MWNKTDISRKKFTEIQREMSTGPPWKTTCYTLERAPFCASFSNTSDARLKRKEEDREELEDRPREHPKMKHRVHEFLLFRENVENSTNGVAHAASH